MILPPGRSPPKYSQSTSTIQSGPTVTRSAAAPDGTYCSAHDTPPTPNTNMSVPMTAAVTQ